MLKLLSLSETPNARTFGIFCLLSCSCVLAIFRGSIWGEAVLAPLDIPPAFYSKFKWLDPTPGLIPRNHYLIDMFDYDLPRTYLAHHALQSEEFPWWDPYTDGGRPLAMEAHTAITDPLRLCIYKLLPFVPAYNLTRIIQSFLSGIGIFVLLSFLRCSQFITVLGALSFQFSGFQSVFFYPENVPSTMLYYPFLWVVLAKFFQGRPSLSVGLGGVLCAAILAAGNPQSHAYLVLFLGCFLAGYGLANPQNRLRILVVVAAAFLIGCAIAAPVVVPQIELFLNSARKGPSLVIGKHMLTGALSLSGIFPWLTGSFRTIDVGKIIDQQGAAYAVFLGTPLMLLAALGGAYAKTVGEIKRPEILTALLLLIGYFLGICSTPLIDVLYLRSAGLASLGLLVLSAAGMRVLLAQPALARRFLRISIVFLALAIAAVHLFSFVIYPRIKERVLTIALQHDANNPTFANVPRLRTFQVNNLANEITFKNPEPLLAFCGSICLLLLVAQNFGYRRLLSVGVFVFNVAPLLIFFSRFTPYSPTEKWNDLLRGGSNQQAAISAIHPDMRLIEEAPTRFDWVFPGVAACYYRVHTLRGYSSFPLVTPSRAYNLVCASEPGNETALLTLINSNQVRFVWKEQSARQIKIVQEGLNYIHLNIAPGPAGILIRTDTFYPGWRVKKGGQTQDILMASGFLACRIEKDETDVVFRYRPATLLQTQVACVFGLVLAALIILSTNFYRKKLA